MALLGKILAILNILAGAAFVYLAARDYSQRQAWAYAVYRFELATNGLPLNADERDPVENVPQVSRLSKATQEQVFQGLTGEPVTTQTAEVERVHLALLTWLTVPGAEAAKRQKLLDTLLPMVRREADRVALEKKIRTAKLDELVGDNGPLERVFKAVLSNKEVLAEQRSGPDKSEFRVIDPFDWAFQDLPPDKVRESTDQRDLAGQRRAIAHLLYNLTPEDEPPQRALTVVGLRAFAEEGTSQAEALTKMAGEVRQLMAGNRVNFEVHYKEKIGELHVLAQQLEDQNNLLKDQTTYRVQNNILLAARVADLKKLQANLEEERLKTQKVLQELATEQQRWVQAQRVVGEGQQKNEALLGQIQQLENPKPQPVGQ